MNIDAVVAKFGTEVVVAVHTGLQFLEPVAVVAILTIVRMHDEVAVLRKVCTVDVLTILDVGTDVEGNLRSPLTNFTYLIEEWPIEVYLLSVGKRIPAIGIPTLLAVDGFCDSRWILTDDALTAKTAGSRVEV